MNFVLSSYPLVRDTVEMLGSIASDPSSTLNELRLLPVASMISRMRSVRVDVLTVVLQEESERAVLPLMLTLAAVARASRIEVNDLASGTVTRVSRFRAALGSLGTLRATIAGQYTIKRLRWVASRLLKCAPQTFERVTSKKALYLKSNLMLGAKAGGSIGHIAGVANELVRLDPLTQVLAPELPPMVTGAARFFPIERLNTYGIPAEVNHFRFNDNCERAGLAALANERFGFIYQRLSLGNLSGVLLSRRYRVPLVIEYNGSEVWISKNWGHSLKYGELAASIEDCCLRHAHRVVTVSEVLVDELVARGVPRERIVWYPNCIDLEVFSPSQYEAERGGIRANLGIKDDEIAVMFIGTFGVWHGAETLASAAKRYFGSAHTGAVKLKFIFVGDGLRLGAVRDMLKNEIDAGQVVLTGLVPQAAAPKFLAAADIFASPHAPSADGGKFFGSPTKLFEYMAMNRPIIASDLHQLGDVLCPAVRVSDIESGFKPISNEIAMLVKPGSVDELLEGLIFLAQNPKAREALAAGARQRVVERYTWCHHVGVIFQSLGSPLG